MLSKTRFIKVDGENYPVTSENSFNILTGEPMSQEELNQLIRSNPNVHVEHVYDKYGKLESFWFNPNKNMGPATTMGRTPTGGIFPEFVFKTTTGTEIASEKLRGKWIILRFEGYPEDFMFKKHELLELDEKINAFKSKGEAVEAVALFYWDKDRAQRVFSVPNSNFKVVANAHRFGSKFKILRYPKTLVIGPDGTLMGYFNYSEDIDLDLLQNSKN
ncbi:peroxiredoxin family protein [Flagellimonas myxillae]|uniref:peroxiredoxin family protein n=1 Tax=Flagellimonas myxillae TaxID=2942214 RepID=UPI00201F8A71|nr:redoxin domain-containing protein [Muricauda myxillae]MCL6265804.1 peroxiredoxin family protein [Muricauda myxillae]